MKISDKQGDYYVSLPELLYTDLKIISTKKDNINLELLAVLTHLILTNKYSDKNNKEGKDWVRLNSKILRSNFDTKKYKSKEHLSFLIEHNIIEMKSHYCDPNGKNSFSRGYRFNQEYFKIEEKENSIFDSSFSIVPINESGLKRKRKKRIMKRKQKANRLTPYLTKWLSSKKFSIDKEKAIQFVNSKYSNEKSIGRKQKRLFHIQNFEASLQIYSMEGRDNRLHSGFTTLPSDLKQFISFDGEKLKEADIKSSQPFILTIVLELIINEYNKELNRKGYITAQHFTKRITKLLTKYVSNDTNNELSIYNMCYNITSIVLLHTQDTDIKQIEQFIFLIRSGDIYEKVGEELLQSGSIWFEDDAYNTKLLIKDTKLQKTEDFETLRKCAKTITLNAIYCSPKTKAVKAVNEFRKLFPVVTIWLDTLKKFRYSDLAVLMQQIEAKSVLSHAAKKLSKKHLKMPLISRHDSLSTTIEYFEKLKSEFEKLLYEYFNVDVVIGGEPW
jgi:hypothetical protein